MGHGTCIVKDLALVDRAKLEGGQHGSEAGALSAAPQARSESWSCLLSTYRVSGIVCVYLNPKHTQHLSLIHI